MAEFADDQSDRSYVTTRSLTKQATIKHRHVNCLSDATKLPLIVLNSCKAEEGKKLYNILLYIVMRQNLRPEVVLY